MEADAIPDPLPLAVPLAVDPVTSRVPPPVPLPLTAAVAPYVSDPVPPPLPVPLAKAAYGSALVQVEQGSHEQGAKHIVEQVNFFDEDEDAGPRLDDEETGFEDEEAGLGGVTAG